MVKNLPANAGDAGSIPESGRSPGEGNGNPLQYSCLGNLMDRGAWRATVHGVAKSWTQLSYFHFHWDIKYTNIHIIEIPEGEEREAENIFEDKQVKSFPNLRKKTNIQI